MSKKLHFFSEAKDLKGVVERINAGSITSDTDLAFSEERRRVPAAFRNLDSKMSKDILASDPARFWETMFKAMGRYQETWEENAHIAIRLATQLKTRVLELEAQLAANCSTSSTRSSLVRRA